VFHKESTWALVGWWTGFVWGSHIDCGLVLNIRGGEGDVGRVYNGLKVARRPEEELWFAIFVRREFGRVGECTGCSHE
jgi:hypothetical protein